MLPNNVLRVYILLALAALLPVVLIAQTGSSPSDPIQITGATTPFNSMLMPETSSSTPSTCPSGYGTFAGPFYNAVWFRFQATKEVKVVDVTIDPYFAGWQGPAILAAFRENTSGSPTMISCTPDRGEIALGNHGDAAYLFMIATPSPGGGTSTLSLTSSNLGVLVFKIEQDYGLLNWGLPDELDFLTIGLHTPGPPCGEPERPQQIRVTALRTDILHQQSKWTPTTAAFRVAAADFDTWLQDLSDQDFCSHVETWPLAVGTTHYTAHDNNVTVSGGKSDTWGWKYAGILKDRTGLCPGGKVNYLEELEAFIPRSATDGFGILRQMIGPRLTCGY